MQKILKAFFDRVHESPLLAWALLTLVAVGLLVALAPPLPAHEAEGQAFCCACCRHFNRFNATAALRHCARKARDVE
jgi:hypothetical protein